MACGTLFRTVLLMEPWRRPLLPPKPTTFPVKSFFTHKCSNSNLIHGFTQTSEYHLNCSKNESPFSSEDDQDQGPPQEVVLKAISVSKTEGRVGQTTNVIIGGTVHNDETNEWLALDKKVNSYPTERGFTAIGTGGDDFVQAMVVAVESVIQQPIPEGQVKQKLSSGGKYVSVNIGPIQVVSSEQFNQVNKIMRRKVEEQLSLHDDPKDGEVGEYLLPPRPQSPSSRPTSMVIKKVHTVIPAHLVAEAISTLHGLDLRWSGPITPTERRYVQQYVFAKYPEYCNGLVEEGDKMDLFTLCMNDESSESSVNEKGKSPRKELSSPTFGSINAELGKIQLEPSRLLDILTKKSSYQGNFISIPEIQVRNRALQQCGLSEDEYLVVFTLTTKEAMMMIGECYPFFRGNHYMTILGEDYDCIREFVTFKESKVIAAPETWLDLRIKGSQLSQYFRKKCKHSPKGLFAYPANVEETRYSMHWISEAHRNSWHVLLDASGLDAGKYKLSLALHRPDFVLCTVDSTRAQPSKITCLLVRKQSFDTTASPAN